MTIKLLMIYACALTMVCCGTKRNAEYSNAVNGVYVREYSFEVHNIETGLPVGNRQIRDTIFIQSTDDGFQLSNEKWRMNAYDNEGWVNMEHGDDRPLPTFHASFDVATKSLYPDKSSYVSQIFIFDVENERLYRGKSHDKPYFKVR